MGVGRGRREQQEKGPRVGPAGEEGGRSAPVPAWAGWPGHLPLWLKLWMGSGVPLRRALDSQLSWQHAPPPTSLGPPSQQIVCGGGRCSKPPIPGALPQPCWTWPGPQGCSGGPAAPPTLGHPVGGQSAREGVDSGPRGWCPFGMPCSWTVSAQLCAPLSRVCGQMRLPSAFRTSCLQRGSGSQPGVSSY